MNLEITFDLTRFVDFQFINPKIIQNDEIKLVVEYTKKVDLDKNTVPEYRFSIIEKESNKTVGYIDFRVCLTESLSKFGGNIGYGIYEAFRGKKYAGKALILVLDFIKKHGLHKVLITCGEKNIASRKTCEYAGAKLIEIRDALTDMNIMRSTCYYVLDLT